jgi:hypothetical protein
MAIEMKKYVNNITYGKDMHPIKIKIGIIYNYDLKN